MKSGFTLIIVFTLLGLVSCNSKSGSSVISGGSLISSIANEEYCTVTTLNKDVVLQFGAFSGSTAVAAFNMASGNVGSLSGELINQTFEIQSGTLTLYGMTVNVSGGDIVFDANAHTGLGSMVLDVLGDSIEMSLKLTRGSCHHDSLSYASALPAELITANYMSLDNMKSISKFRSGAGHDFVDDFETCRSMKHYYSFLDGADFVTRDAEKIFAPFDGVIKATSVEGMGTMFQIQSSAHPYIWAEIFHAELNSGLVVGSAVTAGQELGTHFAYNGDGGNSDIAIWIRRPDGYRLISQFEIMSDDLLADFASRGVADWSTDLYFTDDPVANPHLGAEGLQCADQEFTSGFDYSRDYFELL